MPGAQYRLWRVFALGGLALALALAGRSREARGHADTAIAFSEANGIAHHHGLAYSHLALARVSLDELDRNNATYHLHESELRVLRSGRAALRSLQHLFRTEHLATSTGSVRALSELRSSPPVTFEPAFFVELRRARELQLLVSSKMLGQARAFVEGDPPTPPLLGASIELELATGDVGAARRTLDRWDHQPEPRPTIERLLGTVAVLSAEGRTALAEIALRAALDRAEPELLRQPFLTHPAVMRILPHEARARLPDLHPVDSPGSGR